MMPTGKIKKALVRGTLCLDLRSVISNEVVVKSFKKTRVVNMLGVTKDLML